MVEFVKYTDKVEPIKLISGFDMPIGNTKKSRSIVVQGTPVTITNNHEQDYISLTDNGEKL